MTQPIGPFPSWFMAALIGSGAVWLIYEVNHTAGTTLAFLMLFSVLVIRKNAISSLNDILNIFGGQSSQKGQNN